MGLQGMDGEELGRRIASDLQLKHTALVLMTGLGRQHDWTRLSALGFAGHVSKPIWGRNLREALLAVDAKGTGATPSAASDCSQPGTVQKESARKKSDVRILLAEDNLTNQEVAIAMLTKLGYKADLVVNGTETLHALRKADYDVVLMDCGMPEMDGYEATRCIRESQPWTRNPRIPIIAITADAMSGDREKCLQAGMNDYLAKPIELRQLGDILEKWLVSPPSGGVDASASQSAAKTGTVSNQAVFNGESLLARLMGDQGLAARLIEVFLDDAPQRLLALKNAIEAGDACGARLQAHTLKGAAATVSAEALRAVCSEVQEAATSGNMLQASAMLPQLQEQFELFQATLKQPGWAEPNSQSNSCIELKGGTANARADRRR
jgi:CheY-like chemotaxis protein